MSPELHSTSLRMNSKPLFSVGHIFPAGVMAQGGKTDKEMIVTKISCLKVKKGDKAVPKWKVDLAEHPDLREDVVIEQADDRNVWEHGDTADKLDEAISVKDECFDKQHGTVIRVEKVVYEKWYWFYDSMIKMLKLKLALEESE